MGKKIIFDYMFKDTVLTHVEYDKVTRSVNFINYTDRNIEKAFGYRDIVSETELWDFFETRCISRERQDIQLILRQLGVVEYDPYLIVRKTNGVMVHDDNWIRWEGSDLTYAEARIKMGHDPR